MSKTFSLLITVLFCSLSWCMEPAARSNRRSNKVYLLFGPTRAGKSTFINKLYGVDDFVAVGDPNESESTTLYCRDVTIKRADLLDDEVVTLIDVQGIHDTRLTQDDEVLQNICNFLVNVLITNEVSHLDGIIMFNSLRGNVAVGNMLVLLGQAFGEDISRSCLVLATKGDMLPEAIRANKLSAVNLFCESKHIPCMTWNNFSGFTRDEARNIHNIELGEAQLSENLLRLNTALGTLHSYNLEGIQEALDEIEARALEIFRDQEWGTSVQHVEIENDVLQEYLENCQRTRYVPESGSSLSPNELSRRATEIQQTIGPVASTELVTIHVPREVVYHEVVERQVPVHYEKRRGGLAGFFGGTKSCTQYVTTQEIIFRTKMVDEERQILKPIMKLMDLSDCLGIARQEVRYREESYTEAETKIRVEKEKTTVPVTIDVPTHSLEMCRRMALEEKKASLRRENSFNAIFNRQ